MRSPLTAAVRRSSGKSVPMSWKLAIDRMKFAGAEKPPKDDLGGKRKAVFGGYARVKSVWRIAHGSPNR